MSDSDSGSVLPGPARRLWRRTRPIGGTRPLGRTLWLTAALVAAFAIYTLLVVDWSPLSSFDVFLNRNYHVHELWPELHTLDHVGQRVFCLPVLGALLIGICWLQRSLRPMVVCAVGVIAINVIVLVLKLWLARGRPLSHEVAFFSGGEMYPSGHTANVVLVYGLAVHLVTYYEGVSRRTRNILIGVVCLCGAIMFTTSFLLRWHWFSDLISGYLIGGAVLALTVGLDRAVPFRRRRLVVVPPPAPRQNSPGAEDGPPAEEAPPAVARSVTEAPLSSETPAGS